MSSSHPSSSSNTDELAVPILSVIIGVYVLISFVMLGFLFFIICRKTKTTSLTYIKQQGTSASTENLLDEVSQSTNVNYYETKLRAIEPLQLGANTSAQEENAATGNSTEMIMETNVSYGVVSLGSQPSIIRKISSQKQYSYSKLQQLS